MKCVGVVPLSQNKFAIVDTADLDWVSQWKWSASQEGRGGQKWYAIRRPTISKGKRMKIRMSREIYERHNGAIPEGYVIDHDNNDPLDNTSANLLALTQVQNMSKVPTWGNKLSAIVAKIIRPIDLVDF